MFNVEFSDRARKFLKKCDNELKKRIMDKSKVLKTDPVPHNAVRVEGEIRTFRIRVGDYRILYKIEWEKNDILIVKIDKRPRAYQ